MSIRLNISSILFDILNAKMMLLYVGINIYKYRHHLATFLLYTGHIGTKHSGIHKTLSYDKTLSYGR